MLDANVNGDELQGNARMCNVVEQKEKVRPVAKHLFCCLSEFPEERFPPKNCCPVFSETRWAHSGIRWHKTISSASL